MHARHLLIALALQSVFCSIAISQSKRISNVYLTEKYSHFNNGDASLNHLDYFPKMAAEMGLASQTDMVLEKEMVGANGYSHFKYQQYHGGVPIFGNHYFVHEKDGKAVLGNGRYTPNITTGHVPGISPDDALLFAKLDMKAQDYPSFDPTPVLCLIDPAFPKISESVLLAYQIELESTEPFDKRRYFVDAHTGEVIRYFPLILEEGVPSTAQTKYYGVQGIITDSIGPQMFVLQDPTRGEGIFVTNDSDGSPFTNNSPLWDLTNERQDEVALDAHYCAQQYYDMMSGKFDWRGVDGNGKALRIQVHLGTAVVNAFWTGEYSAYGDGNCLYGPLTTLEVVGHEFTHGMIDYTSNLIYSSESGAINESLADMFGKALEMDSDPNNFSWELGHSFHLSPDAEPFRVLDDPKSKNMPAFYRGEFWEDGAGVHTNSAIGNLWFTMLVDGKQGTNEAGIDFNVPAIGMGKAIEIAFFTNKNYLTEGSDYHDFYQYSLQTAEELYGTGAPEIMAVEEAWKAVGLPGTPMGFDLSVSKPFTVTRTCQLNEFIPFVIDVANLGAEPYLPDMGATLTVTDFNNPDLAFTLTDTILPGELFSITVDDWLKEDVPGFNSYRIELDLTDDRPENNLEFVYYQFYEHPSSDVALTVNEGQAECFATDFQPFFFIGNNSCDTLPAGTELGLSIENASQDVLWSMPYVLADALAPFRTNVASFEVSLAVEPQEMLFFKASLEDDPDDSNNVVEAPAPFLKTIDGDYLSQFNDVLALDNTLFQDSRSGEPLVTYQGESYFGSTGFLNDPERFANCPDFEDFFVGNGLSSAINGLIRMCVDFENSEHSYLEFDLMQFQNNTDTSGSLFTAMLQAKWAGTGSGNEIIFGQTEGVPVHHEIALPAYFKGGLEFKFYTELGDYDLNPLNFPQDDVVLLDNLQLRADFTPVSEMDHGSPILISPNPSKDVVSVRSEKIWTAVELRSINGVLLKKENVHATDFNLEIGQFQNGVYLLRLQNEEGGWAVKKVVKME